MDSNKITLRFVIAGGLALALLVPLALIGGLVEEREGYYQSATQGVTDGWGNAQRVVGPLLVIPQRATRDGWQVHGEAESTLVVAAQTSHADIQVEHQLRERGIFKIPLYVANVNVEGHFDVQSLLERKGLDWSNARLVMGVADPHGIRSVVVEVDGRRLAAEPLGAQDWLGDGVRVDLAARQSDTLSFAVALSLRGSTRFSAILPGVNARLNVASSWPHPSFRGRYLPDTVQVTDDGFTAAWASHELARGLPQTWLAETTPELIQDKGVIFDLYEPVSVYRSVERGIKYGVLFLATTFVTLLCFELATGLRFHFVQYGAAGFAVLLFFLALLALAEHVHFGLAYALATTAMVALTGWYVGRISGARKLAVTFVGVLFCLYGVLYMLLRMEAYALLVGTLVLFGGLAALMWTTRGLTGRDSVGQDRQQVAAPETVATTDPRA